MTDKVQKIREEVEKLKLQLLRGACSSQIAMETMCKEEAYNEVLAILNTVQEEPVSEELEEAADNALSDVLNTHEIVNVRSCLEMFRLGAKWKEQQFEKERLKHCDELTDEQAQIESDFVTQHLKEANRTPTFIDAIEYGMRLHEEQMMAKAIDGEVGYWNLRGLSVNVKLPRSVKEGDKVKVIVIKDE